MIRRFLPTALDFSVITRWLVLLTAVWMTGCINNPIIDEIPDDSEPGTGDAIGKIVMHQTGGFAGVSRTISIGERDGSILLVYTDKGANQRKESPVSPEELKLLWQTIEADDVFTLPTNQQLLETVRDGFFIEITVQRGKQHNQFSVYAPDLLIGTGEKRYNAIVQAIQRFADTQLQTAEEYIVSDMPVTGISIQLLESFPLQVHVVVDGYLSDSCTSHNETTQRRDGNVIQIHITTKRPKDAICLQVITEVTMRVPLEGGFLPGRYKVIVNGVEEEFGIQNGVDLDQDGTLQGKVTIGPLCPVEPCDLPPERIAEIYEARKVIVYELYTETKVTEVNLNQSGEYSSRLRPGSYIVDVSDAEGNELPLDIPKRPLMGNAIPKKIEVRPGEIVVVDFDIDTGIR